MSLNVSQLSQDRQAIVVQGNVPAFLLKLWKIVEDKSYDYLISWSQDGRTFKVHDQTDFSKEILPRFYKHNNFSSFVRQVNMYGFRKIVDPSSGSLKLGRDQWEFFHQHFQQGKPNDLQLVKRKIHHQKEEAKVTSPLIVNLLQDVEKLKNQAETVNSRLDLVKSENEMLWREVSDLRERHHNQQNVINKLIQFFVQLVMSKTDISRKRRTLDYPVITDAKVAKQELQPYVAPNTAFNQYLDDTAYNLSPEFAVYDRVTELSPGTTVLDEGNGTTLPDLNSLPDQNTLSNHQIISPDLEPELTTEKYLTTDECIEKLTAPSPPVTESPFVFPVQYNPQVESIKSAKSETITTPTIDIPDYTPTSIEPKQPAKRIIPRSEALSTPVVNMPPVLDRQTSFNDRREISDDVEKISKSIDLLQDMLSKKKITIDLKNLELFPAYHDLPTQVSVQDLIRLSQNNEENKDGASSSNQLISADGGQLLPYTAPFSPSQLIDSQYATSDSEISRSDFFDSLES